ncbi:MAG: hypothetical protein AABX01_05515 [Candidatus Micrarchaeota archaeon]
MQRKAFIAAPLIGTLIFLVAILVIINIARSESAAIAETVSDSYHNKLVSVVEIYRSDLGSVFNIGLQRNIEYALTSQCWQNFINLETEKTLSSAGPGVCSGDTLCENTQTPSQPYDDVVDEREERLFVCKRSSDIMKQVVCSKPSSDGTYLFSLPELVRIISEQTSFEGITLSAANKDAVTAFTHYDSTEGIVHDDLCSRLVSTVELNCDRFSQATDIISDDDYECCSEFNDDGSCKAGKKVLGCEGGNQFFVRIAIQNTDVFGKFPRVLAEDSAGNKIRAGSISDVDFDAPISYPFFKYLDAAFRFNRILAYGANPNRNDAVGAQRGIIDGSCIGKNTANSGCKNVDFIPPLSTGDFGPMPLPDPNAAKTKYAQDFGPHTLKAACDFVSNQPYGLNVSIGGPGSETACKDMAASPDELINNFNIDSGDCGSSQDGIAFCAYIKNPGNTVISFYDTDASKQVRASGANKLCWYSSPSYGAS